MTLTKAQETAIYDHDHNLIVIAGAGSGKTYVLVRRYLALLEANPTWRLNQLVAITFTKKAAAEMRERVRAALVERAQTGDPVWATRLAAMDSARIDTIHGLCASILRANAAEAALDPAFAMLDEIEARLLLDDVIDQVVAEAVNTRDPALALFREHGESRTHAELARMITMDVNALDDDPLAIWAALRADEIMRGRDAVLHAAETFISWNAAIPADDKLGALWLDVDMLLTGLRAHADPDLCAGAITDLAGSIKINMGAAAAWGGKDALKEAKDVLKAIRDAAAEAVEMCAPLTEDDQRAAAFIPLWRHLIARVQSVYAAAKADRGALDFDDLEQLTADLLENDAPIRARYAVEFKHLLVDEFQDTNAAQWRIVKALAPPDHAGRLFVVGDPKQSIYAFRGADVSVFDGVRAAITGAGGVPVDLNCSFRTHQPLVDCTNALFAALLTRDPASPTAAYEIAFDAPMIAHRESAPSDAPALELLLLDKQQTKASDDETSIRAWQAHEIAARIAALINAGTPVYDKHADAVRPARYGDVALLFQAMTAAPVYEAALKAAGIPYQTIAGRGYYDRQEVWDLLNLLRALHRPADSLALAAALRSPLFNLSDDTLLALRLDHDMLLWDALDHADRVPDDERKQVAFARTMLHDLRALAGRTPIPDLLREALDITGYLAVLTGLPDGARRRGNIEKLLDKARAAGAYTLGAFSAYLTNLSAREAREGEAALDTADAVKLMTVHASKGLEFPIVALVEAAYQWGERTDPVLRLDDAVGLTCSVNDALGNKIAPFAYTYAKKLARARDDAERRRLLYVAATRAADRLIVCGAINRPKSSGITSSGWLNWLLDALDLRDLPTDENLTLTYDWGSAQITQAQIVTSADDAPDEPAADWELTPRDLMPPPLIAPIPRSIEQFTRSINATSIADIGSAHYGETPEIRAFYTLRLRRRVLHEAPARVPAAARKRLKRGALTGEIVHEALRWLNWRKMPDQATLDNWLTSYAWTRGGIDDPQIIERARDWVGEALKSQVAAWLRVARRFYRELPFVYATDKRMIHGVIDLLIERPDRSWALVDYKTAYIAPNATQTACARHAERYHLQVGVYAAAVERLLGAAPQVAIYYIRYNRIVTIAPETWRGAVARLENDIGALLIDTANDS